MSLLVCLRRALCAGAPLLLGACTGLAPTQPAPLVGYQPEAFDASAFSRHYAARPGRTCEAARRALLSQGYVLTAASADQVTARKHFQPDVEHHVQLEFRVVCAAEAGSPAASVAFVSGLKEQYLMRKAKDSASVGVGGIGSLSLPIEGGMEALVKVSSETVVDRALYERLFELVGEHLASAVEPVPAPVAPPLPPPVAARALAPTAPLAVLPAPTASAPLAATPPAAASAPAASAALPQAPASAASAPALAAAPAAPAADR
jgi:hypothetical protein